MHLGQGCVILSPKTGCSCMWQPHAQMEILGGKGRIPSLEVFKICNLWLGAEFGAAGKTVMFEKCHFNDSIHAMQHKCKMQSKSVTTVSLCGYTALGCACCLYPQKYNQNQPWTPADHHADAAAPEDFHLVGTQQQTPADMLSLETLPSNRVISALFHNSCQYPHKATRTLSRAQPICWAFWSCITHCCP